MPAFTDVQIKAAFWSKVEKTEGCWLWKASKFKNGYGQFRRSDGGCLAHRFAYQWAYGSIPAGTEVDHVCGNRACVNPAHLQAVNHAVNLRRGNTFASKNAAKTECSRGHPFAGDNLFINVRGGRVCRICANARVLRLKQTNEGYRLRQKAANEKWRLTHA